MPNLPLAKQLNKLLRLYLLPLPHRLIQPFSEKYPLKSFSIILRVVKCGCVATFDNNNGGSNFIATIDGRYMVKLQQGWHNSFTICLKYQLL